MLKIGRETADPSAPKLGVEGFTDVDSFGEGMTYIGESMGQMLGSMWAAATTGGAAGAAVGTAIGGGAGALAGGVGAVPGAIAGGISGFTKGTLGAFVGMGVGGTFRELLQDKGIQEGLENGSIAPDEIYNWALGAGAVIGALDAVPVANRYLEITGGKKLTTEAVKQMVRKAAAKGAVRGFIEEGATEMTQGAISELSQAILGGDWDTANRVISVINQGLAGGIGGAVPGVAGGIAENARLPRAPETAAPVTPAGETATTAEEAEGGGAAGPGTGRGDTPRRPAGRAGGRGRATVTPEGAVDDDIAAAMGFTEEAPEGEFARTPPIVPRGRVRPKPKVETPTVDPAVSAALTPEGTPPATAEGEPAAAAPSGQQQQQPAIDIPAAPPVQRAPRGRKAPQVETITEEAPQVIEPEEGGVRPWQEEFGPDANEALRRMPTTDQRYPEVVAWANAQDQARLDQFPKEPPVEAAPEEEPEEIAPEEAPPDDQAIEQIQAALSSMGIPTKGSLSAALNAVGRRLGVPNLAGGNPADIVAFLRENGVSVPEPGQRESVVEEEVVEEPPPLSAAEQARLDAELLAIERAEGAVSPWPTRKKKTKEAPAEVAAAPVAEPEEEEKPYQRVAWQKKLKRYAEALKPTKARAGNRTAE